ncbi:hypothetical protein ES705_50122 [subsurface metagenome]
MNKASESKASKLARLGGILKRWDYWLGITGLVLSIAIIAIVVRYIDHIQALRGWYGYVGAFIIGVFGGATYIAPVPMLPTIFILGTAIRPAFAPYLGPVFVGAAAGLGETVGALTIYMTGYGSGAALTSTKHSRVQAIHSRILGWMERRGTLVLFIFSAVINPFFYPIALTAGATRFGLKRYLLICAIGKTIKGISIAAAGYWGLGSILRALGVPI